jgi:hypothetical protein
MKINFNLELKTLEGKIIRRVIEGEPLVILPSEFKSLEEANEYLKRMAVREVASTLKNCAIEALSANFQQEGPVSGEEKARRWLLATRIYSNPGDIDLTSEEISLIKRLIGMAYVPLVVGQTWEMLEGK